MPRKVDITAPTGITPEQLRILAKVARSPFHLADYTYVVHPIKGKVNFKLYDFQKAVLWHFLNSRFNIVKKFRQAGLTELLCLFSLWLAMYTPYQNIIIISIKDRVAKRFLQRIKFMYKNYPVWLRTPIVNGRGKDIGTASELEFSNGSRISSLPTTEDVGRSEPASLVIIDEAAIVKWAGKIWAALFPTLSTGGRGILNSTPLGVGNFYHKMWVDACAGGNPFNPVNLLWRMHPERDDDWYKMQAQILGPRRLAQEVDGDFLASGNTVFDLADIRDIEDYIDELYASEMVEERMNGQHLIYRKPKRGETIVIGADVSTSRASDYSTFTAMNTKGEEIESFKGKMRPTDFARFLMSRGKVLNSALLAPEINGVGEGVVGTIQDEGYPYLHHMTALSKEKGEKKKSKKKIPGWMTTPKTRPIIVAELEEDVRRGNVIIKDREFTREAYTFIYDEMNKPVAMNKGNIEDDLDDSTYSDDAILGKCIANHVRKNPHNTNPRLPR